ncbi:MAG: hypothetical protein AB2L09_00110 [Coriobacteriia bacterium]
MPDLAEKLRLYVSETLHQPLRLSPWLEEQNMPVVLRHQYDFLEGSIFSRKLLFLLSKDQPTPSTVAKHQQMLHEYTHCELVVVSEHATSAWRSRMIERGIQFVVPSSQLYLPTLGIALRERFKSPGPRRDRLIPSAQVVFLHALLNTDNEPSTPTEISMKLGYSPMSIGRALDQLEEFGLVKGWRSGRERFFRINDDRRSIWEKALLHLSTPVEKVVQIEIRGSRADFDPLAAGLTALSDLSMLAPPRMPVHAAARPEYRNALEGGELIVMDPLEDAGELLELWSYSPRLLSDGPRVDPLSLYLSLRDERDERIQSALENLLEGLPW